MCLDCGRKFIEFWGGSIVNDGEYCLVEIGSGMLAGWRFFLSQTRHLSEESIKSFESDNAERFLRQKAESWFEESKQLQGHT